MKSKIPTKKYYKIFAVLILSLVLGSGFLFPLNTQAAVDNCGQDRATIEDGVRICQPSNLNFTVNVQVNGQTGSQQNFVKVGPNGSFTVTVTVTLASPVDLITNKDKIYFPGVQFNPQIEGFGATITPKDTSKVCYKATKRTWFGTSVQYYDQCKTDIGDISTISGEKSFTQTTNASDLSHPVYTKTFTITKDNFKNLGIVNQKTDTNPGLNELYVYPDVAMYFYPTLLASLGDHDWMTSFHGGKSVYVQLFSDDTAAKNDTTPPPGCSATTTPTPTDTTTPTPAPNNIAPPTCVPGYGANTSNLKNVGDSGGLVGLINNLLGIIFGWIQELIFTIFSLLVLPLMESILKIHPYMDVFVSVIYPGWIVVRNTCNIFLIVALIAIAMATLFRIDSYQYKHLLVQLIIAALLINFSLVIGQVILGAADTMQSQFLSNDQEVVRSLGRDLMVTINPHGLDTRLDDITKSSGYFSITVSQFFYLALTVGSFLVFCAITVFLVIRIIALWILLMISPIAYVAGVLPATAKYRDEWWSNFLKYAFFTPIMAFFLNMTNVIVFSQKNQAVLRLVTGNASLGSDQITVFVTDVASKVLLLVFLIASLMISEKLGIYGASVATNIAKQGMFLPFKYGGKAIRAAAGRTFEGIQNKTHITMDPREWSAAWKKYSEEQKAKRKDIRAGKKVFGLNLGSPQDMLKNYANAAAVKRIGRNILTKRELGKLEGQYEKMLEKSKLMSDEEKRDKATQQLQLEQENSAMDDVMKHLNSNEVNRARADEIVRKIRSEQARLARERSDLRAVRARLIAAGQSTSDIDKQIAANAKLATDLDHAADTFDAQLANPASQFIAIGDLYKENGDFIRQGIFDMENEKAFVNGEVGKNAKKINKLATAITNDDAKRTSLHDPTITATAGFSGADKEAVKNSINRYRDLAAQHRSPEAYYAREARLHLEAEEGKKIAEIQDEGELNALLADAINQKDQHKATAIIKKLTKDVNINETLEDSGRETSFKGLVEYLENDFSKVGIDHHELMQIATEVGYIAEETGQFNFARATQIDHKGHLGWNGKVGKNAKGETTIVDESAHRGAVVTQMRKSEPRASAGRIGRFSIVDEWEEGGERKRSLNDVGVAHILRYANPSTRKFFNQFNTYALQAAVEDPEWREKLINGAASQGVRENDVKDLIKEVETIMANKA